MGLPTSRFAIDLAQYRLLDGDRPVALERQPMELLRLLAARPGALVTREDIVRTLWPDGTHVSEDQSINRVIRKLRIALDDDPDEPQFIETVVGKGYRLVGPIEIRRATMDVGPSHDLAAAPIPAPGHAAPAGRLRSRGGTSHRLALVLAAALVVAGACDVWLLYARRGGPSLLSLPQPLTAYAGDESYPAMSPAGDLVAFAWNGDQRDNWDIYVKVVGVAAAPLRLTTDADVETMPAWSPDGQWIAFERQAGSTFDLCVVSPLGGSERCVATALKVRSPLDFSPPAWTSDSSALVVADVDQSGAARLTATPWASGQTRVIASTSAPGTFQFPAVSPDGRSLAYEWCTLARLCDLNVGTIDAAVMKVSTPRPITHDGHLAAGATWTPDGTAVVYGDGLRLGLRRVDISTGSVEPVPGATGGMFPSAAARGTRLVFVTPGWDIHLWAFRDGGRTGPHDLLLSTLVDVNPQISPDGSQVAFGSERAGIGRQIWIGKMDGSGTIAITQPTTRAQGAPRWSEDGRWIAYGEQTAEGTRQVIIVDTSGGRRTRLTADTANEGMPSWSHDDGFVYFGSDRTGRPEIWRAPFQRPGAIEQITFAGGVAAFESADGASVFYTKANGGESPLFMKPLTGTSETTVAPSVFRSDFVPVDDGVYYVSHARPGRQDDFELRYLDLRTRQSSVLSRFQAADVVGLTVSPDRRTIVTSAVRATAGDDLAWIASFR